MLVCLESFSSICVDTGKTRDREWGRGTLNHWNMRVFDRWSRMFQTYRARRGPHRRRVGFGLAFLLDVRKEQAIA
eukprot:1376788-Amorphochlora_amoeboformis.AAC.1